MLFLRICFPESIPRCGCFSAGNGTASSTCTLWCGAGQRYSMPWAGSWWRSRPYVECKKILSLIPPWLNSFRGKKREEGVFLMYFQRLIDRNPQLLEAALSLHQRGRIPPNTWIIDLDMIVENARILSAEATRLGLTTYLMSKQYSRNPYVSALALAHGLYKIVAVDATCALMAHRYGLPVGHMGHLNQIPHHMVPSLVHMRPEVITVYNLEHAS